MLRHSCRNRLWQTPVPCLWSWFRPTKRAFVRWQITGHWLCFYRALFNKQTMVGSLLNTGNLANPRSNHPRTSSWLSLKFDCDGYEEVWLHALKPDWPCAVFIVSWNVEWEDEAFDTLTRPCFTIYCLICFLFVDDGYVCRNSTFIVWSNLFHSNLEFCVFIIHRFKDHSPKLLYTSSDGTQNNNNKCLFTSQ